MRIKTPAQTRVHAEYFVISSYDNLIGHIFKGSATKGIENWLLLTTQLLIMTPSRARILANIHMYTPYIARNYSPWRTL